MNDDLYNSDEEQIAEAKNKRGLKLIRLEVENVKRIKAVRIRPDGNAIIIGGENDQGKTSFLDAIEYLFDGKRAQCERPVREGAKKAMILGELESLVVKRTINADGGSYLTVTNAEGALQKSPQAILDKIKGDLSFDPSAFAKMDKKAQFETAKKLFGIDFTEYDEKIADLVERRRIANAKARDLEGRYREMPEYPEAPKEEISITDLLVELGKVQAKNLEIHQKIVEFEASEEGLDRASERFRQCKLNLNIAKAAFEQANLDLKNTAKIRNDFERKIEGLDAIPEDPIKEKIKNAETINAGVRANAEAQAVKEEAEEVKGEANRFDFELKSIEESKAADLSKVKFPVEGLSFDDGGITFNGLPFNDDQIGSAARLKVSVAMWIAMKPGLDVLLIRNGSLLDEKSRKIIVDMAIEADIQAFIEVVGEDDECQFIIEDGEIKSGGLGSSGS